MRQEREDCQPAVPDGVPDRCHCGKSWVFVAPWWEVPSKTPTWGYMVHCPNRHFAWFAAEISQEEEQAALRRFGAIGFEEAARPPSGGE